MITNKLWMVPINPFQDSKGHPSASQQFEGWGVFILNGTTCFEDFNDMLLLEFSRILLIREILAKRYTNDLNQ